MTNPGADAFTLSRQFIAPTNIPMLPSATQDWTPAVLTAWDPVSYANTVVLGGQVLLQNLPVLAPNGITLGTVLLAKVPGGYIIMGNLGSVRDPGLIDPIRYRSLSADVPAANNTLINAGSLNFQLNTNTQYGIDGVLYYVANSSANIKFAWNGPVNMAAKWNTFGDVTTGTDDFPDFASITTYGDASTQAAFGFSASATCRPSAWFATTDTPGLLQLRFAQNTNNATASILQAGSWLRITELGSYGGANTYIKQYPITASRSYDGSGTYIGATDGDNNLYMGDFSPTRSFGNERSLMIFDAATIRSDLAGAVILSARLFMYCFMSEDAKGSLQILPESYSVVPATYTPATASGFGVNDLWTVPSWNSVECLYNGGAASWLNEILAGKNSLGLTPTSFGRAATGFRGYGFSVSTRPYLEIVYSV